MSARLRVWLFLCAALGSWIAGCGKAQVDDGIEGLALAYGEAVAKSVLDGAYEGPAGPVKPSAQNAKDPPGKYRAALGDGAKLTGVQVVVGESWGGYYWEADALVLPDRRVVYTGFRAKTDPNKPAPERNAIFPVEGAPAAIHAHIDAVRTRLTRGCDLPLATAADLATAALRDVTVDPAALTAARAQACQAAMSTSGGVNVADRVRQVTIRVRIAGAKGAMTAFAQLQREPFGVKEWTSYLVDAR